MQVFTQLKKIGGWLTNSNPLARINRVSVLTFIILLFAGVVIEGARFRDYHMVKTLGTDAAPSVVSAQEIKASVARMSEDLFSELDAKPGENYDLVKDFQLQERKVADAIVDAVRNITYTDDAQGLHPSQPDGEVTPIKKIQEAFDLFLQLSTKAREFHSKGDAAALSSARDVNLLVNKVILPQADALTMVNDVHAQAAYKERRDHLYTGLAATLAVGGFIVLYLLWVQVMLVTRTFKRGVNPLYAAATVIALAFTAFTGYSFRVTDLNPRVAGSDAYPSVKALAETRAHLLLAKAEQSLWLLDWQDAKQHQKVFDKLIAQTAQLAPGQSAESIESLTRKGFVLDSRGYKKVITGDLLGKDVFSGSLADEINNITFHGELDAAVKTIYAFQDFMAADAKIRGLEASGKHDKAASWMVGANPGQGNYVFERLVDEKSTYGTLGTMLKINWDAFKSEIDLAYGHLAPLEKGTPIVLLLIQILVVAGSMYVRFPVNTEKAAARLRAVKNH